LARGFDQTDVNDYFTNYGSTDFTQAAKDAFQYGATSSEIAKATGYSIEEIDAYTESLGLGKLSKYSDGGFTGEGGKFQPAGIVHAGEYVFSQEAVRNLGVGTLDSLHESAKQGQPEGYATGGLVNPSKQFMVSNVINAMNRFTDSSTERHALSDASIIHEHSDLRNKQEFIKEFEKEQKSISKIEETANTLKSLNETNSISNLENVINAKHLFEKRTASSDVSRGLSTQSNIINDVINAAYVQSQRDISSFIESNIASEFASNERNINAHHHANNVTRLFDKSTDRIIDRASFSDSSRSISNNEITRKSIFDRVRELQHVEMNRGFASGGYTGNAGRDEPVGIVHGQEYVFSAPAVKIIGVDTLDNLHQIAKKGKKPGFSDGGFVGGDIGPTPIAEVIRPGSSNNNQSIQLNQDDVVIVLKEVLKVVENQGKDLHRMANKFDAVTAPSGKAFRMQGS
jgi:hypothetical protein